MFRNYLLNKGPLASLPFLENVCLHRNPQAEIPWKRQGLSGLQATPGLYLLGEASAFVGVERRDTDGWMWTDDRTVAYREVRAGDANLRGDGKHNTEAEHIIHSGAYLAERVHAFTLGATDGRGGSYRIHTDTTQHVVVYTHVRRHARNAVLCSAPHNRPFTSANIKRLIYYLRAGARKSSSRDASTLRADLDPQDIAQSNLRHLGK